MNDLQHIPESKYGPVLVTLNPPFEPREGLLAGRYQYDHPVLDAQVSSKDKYDVRLFTTRDPRLSVPKKACPKFSANVPFPSLARTLNMDSMKTDSRPAWTRPAISSRALRSCRLKSIWTWTGRRRACGFWSSFLNCSRLRVQEALWGAWALGF